MIARNTAADVNVIALVGERGKEVRDFIDRDLGEEGLRRSVVIVSTSDQPALVRIKAAFVAMTDRGVFPRSRPRRHVHDGFGHALCDGAAGSRSRDRRTDHDARIYAFGLRVTSQAFGTGRHGREGNDHRPVLGARRRRRHERADRRRRSLDSRRPHRAFARPRFGQSLPGNRRACKASAASCPTSWTRITTRRRPRCATCSRPIAMPKILSISARTFAGSNPRVDLALSKIEGIRHFLRQGIYETSSYEQTVRQMLSIA